MHLDMVKLCHCKVHVQLHVQVTTLMSMKRSEM